MKVVICGLGAGGLHAALTIRKRNKDAEITFIDRKDFDMLHPCGLPYVLEGTVDSFEKLKHTLPDMGFTKILRHEAFRLIPGEHRIETRDLTTGQIASVNYDKLIIATGSSAVIPPIPGAQELLWKGVFIVDSYESTFKLSEFVKGKRAAIVVGAGAIGLETAHALRMRGLSVTVIEMLPCAFAKSLDQDMAGILQEYLIAKGIGLQFGAKLERIEGTDFVTGAVVSGTVMPCDLVILAAGVRSNTAYVKDSGVAFGKWGIQVNERMQTNVPDVYAIGDCVQVHSLIDQRDWMMQLAVAAYKQGIVAGANIAGIDRTYKGALTTFASKIGELEIAATGFTSGFVEGAISGKATGLTKPEWCHGGKELTVKVIADPKTKRIVGGQAIGYAGASERINIISAAIKGKSTMLDLSETEMAYCPALSDTYDVLMQAADNCLRKMER
jgi:NADH oxidase (H2O2-forming)